MVFNINSLEFAPANPEKDFEYAYGLARRTLGPYVEELNGIWPDEFQRKFFITAFADPATRMIVHEGKAIGCFCIQEDTSTVHLKRMYLEPEYQRHGIGRKIMTMAVEKAHQVKKPLELGVLTNNFPAIQAYIKCGFRSFDRAIYSWVDETLMRHKDTEKYVRNIPRNELAP